MARYDYSLDVGQSIKTDDKLKEQPQGCCKIPAPEKVIGDEQRVEEEQLENVPEEKKEEKAEIQESPAPQEQDALSKIEIKPVSFEKAKLLSDFEQEQPKKDSAEQETDEEAKEEAPEEDEKDVNEFLDESFSKESQECEEIKNRKNNKEAATDEQPNRRKWIITAAVILIAIIATAFGYIYFKGPAEPAGAAVTPEMTNITQIFQENETAIEPMAEGKNVSAGSILQENKTAAEPVIEEKNASVEAVLEDFTSALKD